MSVMSARLSRDRGQNEDTEHFQWKGRDINILIVTRMFTLSSAIFHLDLLFYSREWPLALFIHPLRKESMLVGVCPSQIMCDNPFN
jgi:hypothetical protein